ncbi:septum formation initiator family protein [uncultured Pseudacidovorax sp.]|uniref:septum formation initiator family protein n=1 Tax=uncultured Pseudacidovorax sp. TaxID=679313 RepID=UPI0025EA7C0F|nr:septum formation initiator family protein [uncultured Pseudacidovorax sp.]
MRARLIVPAVLVCLLGLLQLQLWAGRGSLPDVAKLRKNLEDQKAANIRAQHTNERLESEVSDLKEGIEMAEERARQELGMVKPNEILVQIAR